MTSYLIIDDEHIAHDIIKGYCDKLPNFKLVHQCYDAIEALDYLRNNPVDLIFLDLNLPKLKGFEFLKTLQHRPKIIVTTAYQEYALEGFELGVVDYLLKPFGFERFVKAVNKAISTDRPESNIVIHQDNSKSKQLFLKSDKKYHQIYVEDILYIEAVGNYSKVILKKNNLLVREKISELIKKIASDDFVQVHKSFAVARGHIENIDGNRIIMDGHEIPIGKFYKSNVMDLLKN